MNYLKGGVILLLAIWQLMACNRKPDRKEAPPQNDIIQPQLPANSGNPYEPVDISPMDMSYFPAHYPLRKLAGKMTGPPVMRVIYSRPHLQGRALFNGVLKYGEPWRLGANEATELDVFRPVLLDDKKINPGRYTLYAIPHEKNWIFVLNSSLDDWGLKQDSTKDLQRIAVPVTTGNPRIEYFTMVFKRTDQGADLLVAWDDQLAKIPFVIK
ncbi:hypothetical protein A8C56_20010 [Niabella ginsenosidivorans]|uniref:DUF2911 domain-containing protein n=1 Tax=Niabella ginsenosidivorans TaxID=1176587 RepID=A0A1A9I5K0_9BACT|nr:DUF2911 domain-containing protein [Niabella ginsenosidivorans]ANH82967.1 hypothetical protein A8C56_20010 [Niabella ginsenosidivorans]